jgi:putative transcriptional regulator
LAKDLTQEQLASQLGVSRQTLIAIENGKYSPSLEFAFALARVLDVEIGQLFSYPE